MPKSRNAPRRRDSNEIASGKHGAVHTVTVPFAKESTRWIDFAGPVGPKGITFFNKAHVVESSFVDGMLTMVVNRKKAVEKGLIEDFA